MTHDPKETSIRSRRLAFAAACLIAACFAAATVPVAAQVSAAEAQETDIPGFSPSSPTCASTTGCCISAFVCTTAAARTYRS